MVQIHQEKPQRHVHDSMHACPILLGSFLGADICRKRRFLHRWFTLASFAKLWTHTHTVEAVMYCRFRGCRKAPVCSSLSVNPTPPPRIQVTVQDKHAFRLLFMHVAAREEEKRERNSVTPSKNLKGACKMHGRNKLDCMQ